MRTFYIFKINKEFKSLSKDKPYNLFKTFEQIYTSEAKDLNLIFDLFNQVALTFDKKKINLTIFDSYRHNLSYTKYNNVHLINNFYTDEASKLIVNKSYLMLKSSVDIPTFLKDIKSDDIFICDFQNKDYFWLDCVI